MTILFKYLFFVLFFFTGKIIFAFDYNNHNISDSVIVEYEFIDSIQEIHIFIHNNSTESIFLFDTYFNDHFFYLKKSYFLHRYNKITNVYNISFLPLIYSLAVFNNNYLYIGEDVLKKNHYYPYSFTEITSNSYFKINISCQELFPYFYMYDFDINNIKKYKKRRHKKYSIEQLYTKEFTLKLSLAIYNDISLLIGLQDSYTSNELIKSAKNYRIIDLLLPYEFFRMCK